MIRSVMLGEEIVVKAPNKCGLLADIALMLAANGVNIEAVSGYGAGSSATLTLITSANLTIVKELRRKRYRSVKEEEVLLTELENKPGALKVVTTELRKNRIDIKRLYVTSGISGGASRMVMLTNDNEKAMALLAKYVNGGD